MRSIEASGQPQPAHVSLSAHSARSLPCHCAGAACNCLPFSAAGEMLYENLYQHRQLQLHDISCARHAGHEADEAPGVVFPQGLSPCLLRSHGTVQSRRSAHTAEPGRVLGALPMMRDKGTSKQHPS